MGKKYVAWLMLSGLFICYVISNGVILNTLPIFYPELISEFGWDQAEVTRPAQWLFFIVALISPVIGTILDRGNPRRVMLGGTLLMIAAFFWFAHIRGLLEMTGVYVLFSLGIVMGGIIPSMYILTKWFVRYRGIAVGILLVGSSFGGTLFNPIAAWGIATLGWRGSLLLLGAIAAICMLGSLFLFIRNRPEDIGLGPDGREDGPSPENSPGRGSLEGPALGDALRSPSFYLLMLVTGAMWFCIVGVIQHQALYFKDIGERLPSSAGVLSVFFFCSILGKLLFGKLGDRYPKKHIMLIATLNLALGALLLVWLESYPAMVWAYAVVFGIGFSGTFTMIQVLVADFYAGKAYGKILGIVTMVDTLSGVMGILVLGQLRSAQGNYAQALLILLVVSATAAACVPFVKNPAKKSVTIETT
ncbi:MAG: MFS transporter [Saprospiraceae bacterium]